MFHDGRNTNHNPHATPPASEPQAAWRVSDHQPIGDAAQIRVLDAVPRPVVADGRLYLGGRGIACYEAETGDRQWRREYDDRYVVGLAVAGGRLHVVEREVADSGSDPRGHLSVVDTSTGQLTHRTDCRRRPSTPVTDGDAVVVPSGVTSGSTPLGLDAGGSPRTAVSTCTLPPPPHSPEIHCTFHSQFGSGATTNSSICSIFSVGPQESGGGSTSGTDSDCVRRLLSPTVSSFRSGSSRLRLSRGSRRYSREFTPSTAMAPTGGGSRSRRRGRTAAPPSRSRITSCRHRLSVTVSATFSVRRHTASRGRQQFRRYFRRSISPVARNSGVPRFLAPVDPQSHRSSPGVASTLCSTTPDETNDGADSSHTTRVVNGCGTSTSRG